MKNKKILLLILIIILLLITNVYAWFIFNNNANVLIETSIKSWDIDFIDAGTEVKETIEFDIEALYPGMEKAEKNIVVKNNGDVAVDLECKIKYLRIFDEEKIVGENCTEEELMEYIQTLPLEIKLDVSKTVLEPNDDLADVNISLNWDFEDETENGIVTEKDEKDTELGIKAYEYSKQENTEENNFSMQIEMVAKQKKV